MKLFDRLGKLRDRRRPYCTMIVPAAGESRRMGGGNKLLLPLEGEPVLAHTLRAIDAATLVDEIILSTRTECLAEMAELCRRCGLQKPVRVVVGGETRTHSVLAAALEANEKARLIAVHDGARPLIRPEQIDELIRFGERTYAAARRCRCRIPSSGRSRPRAGCWRHRTGRPSLPCRRRRCFRRSC